MTSIGLAPARCLSCRKLLTGKKQERNGYCNVYCKNKGASGLPAPRRGRKPTGLCQGVNIEQFITALRELCESEDARNYPLGKRSAMYEIYNRNIVPNFNKDVFEDMYKHINVACENGDLDDDYFEDSSRKLSHRAGDVSVEGALYRRLSVTELNHWKDQPVVPIIVCEKDGHQGILSRVTNPLQVRLFTSKGTLGRSFLISIAKEVAAIIKNGKKAAIGYIGDHDAAGLYRIERTARDGNLTGQNHSIGLRQHLIKMNITDGWDWERVALTHEQFGQLNPDALGDVEGDDKCNDEYIAEYGTKRADVEALGFEGMRDEVRKFIDRHTNKELWEQSQIDSKLSVMSAKALLDLYTRDKDVPLTDEFDEMYTYYLSTDNQWGALLDVQQYFVQKAEVVSKMRDNTKYRTNDDGEWVPSAYEDGTITNLFNTKFDELKEVPDVE